MMKRFKFLGALFVGLIGLVSFGFCGYVYFLPGESNISIQGNSYLDVSERCIYFGSSCNTSLKLVDNNNILSSISNGYYYCFSSGNKLYNPTSSACTVARVIGTTVFSGFDGGGSSSCDPQYTSEECQQEYSLMPISSCDSEYCNLNGYCTFDSGECPEFSGNVSSLYINGISHIGAPVIDITIPLEYQRDYMLTGNIFNLVVSGYNVDYEYIDNIIKTQRSTPDDEDLNNIVSGLIPLFVPGLVIIVFIIFIFRFIKKIF